MRLHACLPATLLALGLSGCFLNKPVRPDRVSTESVIGCYEATDGVGYDVALLELRADQRYSMLMTGHIGPIASSEGRWRLDGNRIVFDHFSGSDFEGDPMPPLLVGRRWPYRVLAHNAEQLASGWGPMFSVYYRQSCPKPSPARERPCADPAE